MSAAATAERALHPWLDQQPLMCEQELRTYEDRRGAAQVGWMPHACGKCADRRAMLLPIAALPAVPLLHAWVCPAAARFGPGQTLP